MTTIFILTYTFESIDQFPPLLQLNMPNSISSYYDIINSRHMSSKTPKISAATILILQNSIILEKVYIYHYYYQYFKMLSTTIVITVKCYLLI